MGRAKRRRGDGLRMQHRWGVVELLTQGEHICEASSYYLNRVLLYLVKQVVEHRGHWLSNAQGRRPSSILILS